MIGDRDGVKASQLGVIDQLIDGEPPIGLDGVGVQLGLDVALFDERGNLAAEFAAILPQLRRDVRQAKRLINFLLGSCGDRLDAARLRRGFHAIVRKQAVLVQSKFFLLSAFAQSHIVIFRAGEIQQRRAIARFIDDAQINLDAAGEAHGQFRFAFAENLLHHRH